MLGNFEPSIDFDPGGSTRWFAIPYPSAPALGRPQERDGNGSGEARPEVKRRISSAFVKVRGPSPCMQGAGGLTFQSLKIINVDATFGCLPSDR